MVRHTNMYHPVCHLFNSSIKHYDFTVLSVGVFMVFILSYVAVHTRLTDYLVFMYKISCTACKGQCLLAKGGQGNVEGMIVFIIATLNTEQCYFIIFRFPASI